MQNMKAKQGQSFLDLVLQQTGSFTDVVTAAILNKKSLTEDLKIQDSVNTETISNVNQVKIFNQNNPATALAKGTDTAEGKGIGWMKVGSTFKVG